MSAVLGPLFLGVESCVQGDVHLCGAYAAAGLLGAALFAPEQLLAAAMPRCHGCRRGGPCSSVVWAGKVVCGHGEGVGDAPRPRGLG